MTDWNDISKYYQGDRKGYDQLPEEIFGYPALEVLRLGENNLQELDARIGDFQHLYSLDLGYNKLKSLPDSFAQLQQLEYLTLSSNQFSVLPAVLFQLPKLRYVYFMNNKLEEVPAGISNCTKIEVLDLGNNQLHTLPASFAQLQQLERLNLTFNQFTAFPEVLCSLPKLYSLRFKRNKITHLPAAIGQLKALVALDLGFNPLEDLPASFADLEQLKKLSCTSNNFSTFPEALLDLPQLTNLADLDLEFRLGLSTKLLQTLFAVLKKIKQQKGSLATKKAAFALLFDKSTDHILPTNIQGLLSIPNKVFQKKVHQYLTASTPLFTKTSQLFLLGTASMDHLEDLPGTSWTQDVQQATHIVLGQKIKKSEVAKLPAGVAFLSELQVQRHYQPLKSLEWLEDHKTAIQDLLYSKKSENILLALQWLEGSTWMQRQATSLLIAYIQLPFSEKEGLKALQQAFQVSLPDFELQQLPHVNFKLYTPEKSELDIAKRITQCTASSPYWKGLEVAHYLFQKHQAGYLYLIKNLPADQLTIWLQQFLKGDTLDLSTLKELKKLPFLEGDWSAVRRLNLCGCAFVRAPQPELLKQMPNLEEIDLRDNPIRHLPRTLLTKLSTYRLFISK